MEDGINIHPLNVYVDIINTFDFYEFARAITMNLHL